MRVGRLKVDTLEIALEDIDADVLEVGLLRAVRARSRAYTHRDPSTDALARYVYDLTPAVDAMSGTACHASGAAVLTAMSDGTGRLAVTVTGLGHGMPGRQGLCRGFLIHDLTVPADLPQVVLAALPHGPDGLGNSPGSVFTVDGRTPVVGASCAFPPNTVWVAVGTRPFSLDEGGNARLSWELTPETGWCGLSLPRSCRRLAAGEGVLSGGDADPDSPDAPSCVFLPSGLAAEVLKEAFIKAATAGETGWPQGWEKRLASAWADCLAAHDADGDGTISPTDVSGKAGCFLAPGDFNRFAVAAVHPDAAGETFAAPPRPHEILLSGPAT